MKSVFFILLLIGATSFAKDNVNNDRGSSDDAIVDLSRQGLARRFHVTGDIVHLSKDGERVLNFAGERRDWWFGSTIDKPITSNWSFEQKGLPAVAIRHEWSIDDQNRIHVHIQQFEKALSSDSSEIKFEKLVREKNFILKDFEPIVWAIESGTSRLAVRLIPDAWKQVDVIEIGSLPIAAKNATLYDSEGKVWAEIENFSGKFMSIKTVHGRVMMSYQPFKGAVPIGEAKEGRITIREKDGFKLTLRAEQPFMPGYTKAKVYARIDREKKSERLSSVWISICDTRESFEKEIDK